MLSDFEGELKQLFDAFEPLPQRCARNKRRLRVYLWLYVLLSSAFGCAVIVVGFFALVALDALESVNTELLAWTARSASSTPVIIGILWVVCMPPIALWCHRATRRPERYLLAFLGAQPVALGECKVAKSALHDAVIAAGMPMPRLALISDTSLNAFVVAHSAPTAWIGVTSGLLGALSQDELRSVMAHLVARIRDGSAVTATVLAELFLSIDGSAQLGEGGMYAETGEPPSKSALVTSLARWVISASSLVVLSGYKRAQQVIAESADVEAMMLTRDPTAMLGALRTVLPADNRPGTIWDPWLREDVFGALFFAWPTVSFAGDEELVRIRRMREVLGAAGA